MWKLKRVFRHPIIFSRQAAHSKHIRVSDSQRHHFYDQVLVLTKVPMGYTASNLVGHLFSFHLGNLLLVSGFVLAHSKLIRVHT